MAYKADKLADLIKVYLTLFDARSDVFAVLKQWHVRDDNNKPVPRKAYVPSTDESNEVITNLIGTKEWGEIAALAHVKGEHFLGVYPISPDSTVKFFALDFDGKHGDPWVQAKRQQKIFQEEAGLPTYLEISRSGEGYHLWGFFDEPIDAGKVNGAVRPFIERVEVFDRMVPMQNGITPMKPLGNLIALPLFGPFAERGKNIFVTVGENGEPIPVKNHLKFFHQIEKIPVERVYELFENTPEGAYVDNSKPRLVNPEALGESYKLVHPVVGCEWVRWCYDQPHLVDEPAWYALACQFAQLKNGRELFHEWSKRDRKRYITSDTDKKFDQALEQNKPHRCDTIRDTLRGTPCECDKRFPDIVKHPYDLVKVPLQRLMAEMETTEPDTVVVPASRGLIAAFDWAKEVHKNPEMGKGLSFGFPDLDEYAGMRDGELIIIAARPSIGKSALAADIAYRVASAGTPVYFFSLEMSQAQLWRRLLCRGAQVSHSRMASGQMSFKDWRRLNKFKKEIQAEPIPFYIDDVSTSTSSIIEVVGSYLSQFGKGIVIFDYLQLAKALKGESRFDKVSRIVAELKLLAKFLQIPVIALAQLNRGADDTNAESEPMDSWLRDSGDIEAHADLIMFLLGKRGPGIKQRTLIIHKQRNGEAGIRLPWEFNQPVMTFGTEGLWSPRAPVNGLILPPTILPGTEPTDNDIMWGMG